MKHIIPAIVALLLVAAAVPAVSATDTGATITNETPVVDSVSVAATVTPTAGTTTAVSVTITASDGNGYQDLSSVQFTVYKPDGTTVHVASKAATSNADGSGTSQTYAGTFNMQFHDDAATGASTYKVSATATDAAAADSAVTTATFNYAELAALSLSSASLSFGSLAPGDRSATSTLTVTNHGNVQIDIETSGTALSNGAGQSIAASNVKLDLVSDAFGAEQSLTTGATAHTAFDLAKGASSTRATYWALAAPAGSGQYIPAGSYSGTLTVSAVQG